MAPRKILGKVETVQKVWLNKKEAMAYLGCKEDFLRKLRENAEIKFSQFGGEDGVVRAAKHQPIYRTPQGVMKLIIFISHIL